MAAQQAALGSSDGSPLKELHPKAWKAPKLILERVPLMNLQES